MPADAHNNSTRPQRLAQWARQDREVELENIVVSAVIVSGVERGVRGDVFLTHSPADETVGDKDVGNSHAAVIPLVA